MNKALTTNPVSVTGVDEESMLPPIGGPKTFIGITKKFAFMGWFAHVALFQKDIVEKERWMTPEVFTELLALGQCLPGPTSTQVSFAIGVVQKGVLGGLLSGSLFQYPGFLIMALAGMGAAEVLENPADWLSAVSAGLSAAGVALVVDACYGLATKIAADRDTQALCIMSACVAFYVSLHATPQSGWVFPLLLLIGGIATTVSRRDKELPPSKGDDSVANLGFNIWQGCVLIVIWAVVLIVVILMRNNTEYEDNKELHWFETFYRVGSIIFGGGQVVLPLLQDEVADWVTAEQFFTGLALVQALPGPLFNLAAYLGAVAGGVPGIFLCWIGLFGPGVMLIFGVLPIWGWFRDFRPYKLALPGLNSSAVGLVVAACFSLSLKVYSISPFSSSTVIIGIVTFCMVHVAKIQAPLAILCGGVMGLIAWAVDMQ